MENTQKERSVKTQKNMKRSAIKSSNLASVGYNKSKKILEIEFTHGGVYQYFEVPGEVYSKLLSAESAGKFFNSEIRDKFSSKRV